MKSFHFGIEGVLSVFLAAFGAEGLFTVNGL